MRSRERLSKRRIKEAPFRRFLFRTVGCEHPFSGIASGWVFSGFDEIFRLKMDESEADG